MNSLTLKESGFAEFVPLNGLAFCSVPSNKGSIVVLAEIAPTAKAPSDILYIGRSKKLAKRIFGGYLSGYGGKGTRKINCKLLDEGYLEKVSISWILTEDPKSTQKDLLETFKKEHGEYPAWNATKKAPAEPAPPAKAPKTRAAPRKPVKRSS